MGSIWGLGPQQNDSHTPFHWTEVSDACKTGTLAKISAQVCPIPGQASGGRQTGGDPKAVTLS